MAFAIRWPSQLYNPSNRTRPFGRLVVSLSSSRPILLPFQSFLCNDTFTATASPSSTFFLCVCALRPDLRSATSPHHLTLIMHIQMISRNFLSIVLGFGLWASTVHADTLEFASPLPHSKLLAGETVPITYKVHHNGMAKLVWAKVHLMTEDGYDAGMGTISATSRREWQGETHRVLNLTCYVRPERDPGALMVVWSLDNKPDLFCHHTTLDTNLVSTQFQVPETLAPGKYTLHIYGSTEQPCADSVDM